jgi:hypothetical protein
LKVVVPARLKRMLLLPLTEVLEVMVEALLPPTVTLFSIYAFQPLALPPLAFRLPPFMVRLARLLKTPPLLMLPPLSVIVTGELLPVVAVPNTSCLLK